MIWCIKTYIIAYVKKKIRFIIHYVKPTAQLLFNDEVGCMENVPCISGQAQSEILRIWQEAHAPS